MNTNLVFAIQSAGSLVVFAMFARWYWAPRLSKLPQAEALTQPLLIHATRFMGLSMIVPTIVAPDLPSQFSGPAAYGDLIAAVLAMASIVALRLRLPIAPVVVWLFSIEGIIDLANAIVQGLLVNLPFYQLGIAWLIFTVLVPGPLLVTHVMVLARLVRPSGGEPSQA